MLERGSHSLKVMVYHIHSSGFVLLLNRPFKNSLDLTVVIKAHRAP